MKEGEQKSTWEVEAKLWDPKNQLKRFAQMKKTQRRK